jgi:transposase
VDHQPRSSIPFKKGARDRLIALAKAHPEWVLGFEDETWWSRLAQPSMQAWRPEGQPLRLVEQQAPKGDSDPKALACYGLLLSGMSEAKEEIWLRFVDGRPISCLTTQFLTWCCARLEAAGKKALLLIWDNASWHTSRKVRGWLREHNARVKHTGQGVRIVCCYLPTKSPWLNPIEPHWLHGKRRVAEAARRLSADELAERICASFGCAHEEHLFIPENVG